MMGGMPPGDGASGLKPVLRMSTDGDGSGQGPGNSSKAVQIVNPEAEPAPAEDNLPRKQFNAGIGARRLSGRMPPVNMSTKSLLATATGADSVPSQAVDSTPILGSSITNGTTTNHSSDPAVASSPSAAQSSLSGSISATNHAEPSTTPSPAPQIPMGSHCGSKYHHAGEMLMARVGEWLDRERKKAGRRKRAYVPRKSHVPPQVGKTHGDEGHGSRERADSIDSQSSEVSLDRLQQILDDGMSSLGLSAIPTARPPLGKKPSKHRKAKSYQLNRVPSSDTDYVDGEAVVPSCEAALDNSNAMGYSGGLSAADDPPPPSMSKKEAKSRQGWTAFKNEVIRLAHTLRLKGWRSVPLEGGDMISVERISGAMTNAVYVVTPPKESALVPVVAANGRPASKKTPKKLLLRVYGPFVDQLIDRQTELKVLRRLAKKKIGPRLLGTFNNGRFEEYFHASALNFEEMRDPQTSRQIAKRMRELHEGIELLDEERDAGPGVWRNWDKWADNVSKRVVRLDELVRSGDKASSKAPWRANGFVCGVEWELFSELVNRHRAYVIKAYGGEKNMQEQLVFAHGDTQYGNILRQRPDDQKSPLLQPANKHKQLIVIDFEYAAANVVGYEFANHFVEWCYNYHDDALSHSCQTRYYPTPEEQHRFLKAYVDHRPQFPHAGSTPRLTPLDTPTSTATPTAAPQSSSTSSIVDFMLDARASGYRDLAEEDRVREEKSEKAIKKLREETRLWRPANSAKWVAWGIVQANMGSEPSAHQENGDGNGHEAEDGAAGEHEYDYLSYAQDRAYLFLGDCLQLGLVTEEELGAAKDKVKIVEY